jgi:Trk K+ transport system NAD-binding subunit
MILPSLLPSQQLLLFFQNKTTRRNFITLTKFFALLILIVVIYSVLFHMIMLYEGREFSWITGVYWALTVMTTLGFGDITFKTDLGLVFTLFVLLSGIIFMLIILPFTFIQFFYAPWLEVQAKAKAPSKLPKDMHGHVIITGLDSITQKLIQHLRKKKYPYVVLAADLQTAAELHEAGYQVVVGLPDDPQTYNRVRVHDASMVITTLDDLINTNISFTVREICENVPIVTNADKDHSVDILQYPGNMHVFQFMRMLGEGLAERTLGINQVVNVIARYDGLRIGVVQASRSTLMGKNLLDSGLREKTGITVVGIWEKGVLKLPLPEAEIHPTSVLVLAGTDNQLEEFEKGYSKPTENIDSDSPVLILGGGRVGNAAAENLEKAGVRYKIVEKRPTLIRNKDDYIQGDAGDLETLKRAGIEKARSVIITTHDDDMNIYLTFYCRQLRQDVQILSRAAVERSVSKLHRAGADLVMSYASMAAGSILNILLPYEVSVFTDGLVVFNTSVPDRIVGKTIIESRIRQKTGCSIVALRNGKGLKVGPSPQDVLSKGAELILVGTDEAERRYTSYVEAT